VVGVMPPVFRFPTADFQVWVTQGSSAEKFPQIVQNRALRIFTMAAHLRPGVSLSQAQPEIDAIATRLSREYPLTNENIRITLMSFYDQLVSGVRPALLLLLGSVGLLLFIACGNVANLMLARVSARGREMAVRVAIGAPRRRILRQLLIESLLVAVLGGTAGLLLAMWGVDALRSAIAARLPRGGEISVDSAVLGFTFGVSVLTGLLFGLLPALHASSEKPASQMQDGVRTSASPAVRRVRGSLVVVEVALAVIVLIAAGLLIRSFAALTGEDAGFQPDHVLTFNTQFLGPEAQRNQLAAEVLQRLAGIPGVTAVGGATGLPPVTAQRSTTFEIEGRQVDDPSLRSGYFIATTPGVFAALGTPVVEGRTFTAQDGRDAPKVALIMATSGTRGSTTSVRRRCTRPSPRRRSCGSTSWSGPPAIPPPSPDRFVPS
jgi:predicted permease